MWEIAAIEEWAQGYPPAEVLPSGSFTPRPCHFRFELKLAISN
jgi:hypothetical protein